MPKNRVVLVHNILPPYRVDLFNEIAKRCEDFHIIFARRDHPRRRSWGWTFEQLEASHTVLGGHHAEVGVRSVGLSFGTTQTLDEIEPSCVVAAGWDLHASWMARRWARRNRVPFVVWSEASQASGQLRSSRSDQLRSRFLAEAALVLVPGERSRNYAARLAPRTPSEFLPNAVSQADVDADPIDAPRRGSAFIGELSEKKGFDRLAAAVRQSPQHFPLLSIAGVGPLEPVARDLVAEFPHQVEYLGPVDQAERIQLMQRTSVLLLPSRRDPWPLVAVEALCHGVVPVLSPEVGSAPDLVPFGAVVADPLIPESFARAALDSAEGAIDIRRALASFSPSTVAGQFLSATTKALEEHAQ